MANPVHLLVRPLKAPADSYKPQKGYTAREANRLLGRTGQPFWKLESCYHSVCDDRKSDRVTCTLRITRESRTRCQRGRLSLVERVRKAEMNLGSAGMTACATKT